MLIPIILSGGSGTRLWPLSRELHPKQFLPVVTEQTLLQETVQRLSGLEQHDIETTTPIVVCNEEHRFLVAEQLREIDIKPQSIILEPEGKNTAPAITVAAIKALEFDPEAVMLVMPADHVIQAVPEFHKVTNDGYRHARNERFVTFGIVPTAPETGYGYIRSGDKVADDSAAMELSGFVEKPDRETAEKYLAQGNYFWNSGMFMFKASAWLDAVKHFSPAIHSASSMSMERAKIDNDFTRLDKESFCNSPSDSIDYAVMEKIPEEDGNQYSTVVIPMAAGWSDVGSWPALWEIQEKDEKGNVVKGDVIAHNTRNSLVLANERLLATVGVDDLIIVETADAVLVGHKDSAQDVKLIAQQLKQSTRDEHATHRRTHRPWGSYECIDYGHRFQVKRITVNPGASLSLQMHYHRAEHWVVVSGTARVIRGEEVITLSENQSSYIPVGVKHRLENPGSIPLEMIEVQSGSYLGEDDIVRFEDTYGRHI